ncbi:MAG: hypothetical protein H6748_17365 [Spirochaetaceae bacterium]|nr:hypothetical protein [Myxococcales bacterium]MCB9725820.1 hypothetical protein [Spirochaetaceae bacterium]
MHRLTIALALLSIVSTVALSRSVLADTRRQPALEPILAPLGEGSMGEPADDSRAASFLLFGIGVAGLAVAGGRRPLNARPSVQRSNAR